MDTVAGRLAKYQRRLRDHGVVAATLLALVTIFSAVKFSEGGSTPSWASSLVGAIFLTMIVVAGCLLALARGQTQWQHDLLLRNLSRSDGGTAPSTAARLQPDMLMDAAARSVTGISEEFPRRERKFWPTTLIFVVVLGFVLAGYSWLPVWRPPRQAPAEQVRREVVGLPVSVHFDVDSAVVPGSMRPHLEALARRVAALPNVSLVVEGHADADYRSDYNLELSRSRAEAVKLLLIVAGIAPDRITVLAHGEMRSSGLAGSPASKAHDRRADVTLVPTAGAASPSVRRAP